MQDLPQEYCFSTETPPFRHAKSEVMHSHCVCTFVRLRVLNSTCFLVVPVVDARQTAAVVVVNKSVEEMVS